MSSVSARYIQPPIDRWRYSPGILAPCGNSRFFLLFLAPRLKRQAAPGAKPPSVIASRRHRKPWHARQDIRACVAYTFSPLPRDVFILQTRQRTIATVHE
jgi:hypothetical protein